MSGVSGGSLTSWTICPLDNGVDLCYYPPMSPSLDSRLFLERLSLLSQAQQYLPPPLQLKYGFNERVKGFDILGLNYILQVDTQTGGYSWVGTGVTQWYWN